jgi:hypothetical protein
MYGGIKLPNAMRWAEHKLPFQGAQNILPFLPNAMRWAELNCAFSAKEPVTFRICYNM